MTPPITLLIVEDDPALAQGLAHNLAFEGYRVLTAPDAETGLARLGEQAVDLILLDVLLPGMSGFELCRLLRDRKIDTPVLMLTARGEELDRVLGLELGADDYLTKPFSLRELLARIRAVLRRTATAAAAREGVTFGRVEVDFERFETRVAGRPVHLSPLEFALLKFFLHNEGRVVSRDELLDRVWGYDDEAAPATRTVDNHVAGLRTKLEADPDCPVHLLTVHGRGYKFVR